MNTIRLYHPHTHEGVAYTPPPEGVELTVNDADAAFLKALGLTTPPPSLVDAPVASTQTDALDTDDNSHVNVADQEDTAA
jgi:hypothetical protein